jgi:hypothetical protein
VTADKEILKLGRIHGIEIVNPAQIDEILEI